jgi:hypothetical protein
MPHPLWLTYMGPVSALIAAVAGVAGAAMGAAMGYVAFRRIDAMKVLELRLELRRVQNSLRPVVEHLPAHLQHARKSHLSVASANGLLISDELDEWIRAWEADFARVMTLVSQLPAVRYDTDSANPPKLEAKLRSVYAMNDGARRFQEKYDATLAADERERECIRARARARSTDIPSQSGRVIRREAPRAGTHGAVRGRDSLCVQAGTFLPDLGLG